MQVGKNPVVTFVIPIIRHDHIKTCLETLYEFTDVEFRVIVVDQTPNKKAQDRAGHMAHLWIKSYRNLGFSKAMNYGIRLTDTPYIGLLNDDIEFLDKRWWQGVIDTFETDSNIIAVNPMSPKEGAWGYGLTAGNKDIWKPRDGFVTDDEKSGVYPVVNGNAIDTPVKARRHYDDLLDNHPVWRKDSVCDAIATWCTVFKKEGIKEMGLFDEQFYPGSGEDYDMDSRAYSCAFPIDREDCDPEYHRRMVGTSRSWVWHYWSSSKDSRMKNPDDGLFLSRSAWNNNDELWSPKHDVWGHYTDENGVKRPARRNRNIFIDEL